MGTPGAWPWLIATRAMAITSGEAYHSRRQELANDLQTPANSKPYKKSKLYLRKDSSLELTNASSIHSLLHSYAQHDDSHHHATDVSFPELSLSIYSKYDHFTERDHKNANRTMSISKGYRGATLRLLQRRRLR